MQRIDESPLWTVKPSNRSNVVPTAEMPPMTRIANVEPQSHRMNPANMPRLTHIQTNLTENQNPVLPMARPTYNPPLGMDIRQPNIAPPEPVPERSFDASQPQTIQPQTIQPGSIPEPPVPMPVRPRREVRQRPTRSTSVSSNQARQYPVQSTTIPPPIAIPIRQVSQPRHEVLEVEVVLFDLTQASSRHPKAVNFVPIVMRTMDSFISSFKNVGEGANVVILKPEIVVHSARVVLASNLDQLMSVSVNADQNADQIELRFTLPIMVSGLGTLSIQYQSK